MTSFELFEGLRKDDLVDLVLPLISIDEYTSKIDNGQSIVVGFFVSDEDAADDLAFFVEKSSIDILDTDVSPVPTPEGYFISFIEFLRNEKFPKNLLNTLKTITNLTSINEWQFKPFMTPNIVDVTEKNIRDHISLEPDPLADKKLSIKRGINAVQDEVNDIKKELSEAVLFLQDSDSTATIKKNAVIFETAKNKMAFRIAGFGSIDNVMRKLNLVNKPFKLNESSLSYCNKLNVMLGPQWFVADIENYLLISNRNFTDVMALQKSRRV